MIATNRILSALAILLGSTLTLTGCSSENGGDGGGAGSGGGGGSGGTEPLRILVTNDDGVGAEGIDAIVQALVADSNNIVVVSAPASNASGSGDSTIDDEPPPACRGGTGDGTEASTASGYDTNVWSVDGCPADSVIFGLENLYPEDPPHVVVSGINEGQNVGDVNGALSQLSGTVGAAKTSACLGVPAVASSQGDPESGGELDYDSGVVEVLNWLEANRAALLNGDVSLVNITSINIPTCNAGAIRGRAEVPLGTTLPDGVGSLLGPQDCESTFEDPEDDLEAFFNGIVSITPVPSNSSNTCDNLSD